MTLLASATELAGWMQKDLDTYTANQALTLSSDLFEDEADTKFSVTSTTYTAQGYGQAEISLPRRPVVAVQSITVDGIAVTDYAAIGPDLYRILRWGGTNAYASTIVITYTYGYAAVPDRVKEAVLWMASQVYDNPAGLAQIQIGSYSEQYANRPMLIDWRAIALGFRVGAVA